MAKGRKQKPDNVKVIQGTFRDDRSNSDAPPPDPELPRSPIWLTPAGREYFGVLKERLDALGLASKTFTEMHALTAQRLADLDSLIAEIHGKDDNPGVGWSDYRIAARYETAVKHVQSLLAELGLSQVSISKVNAPKKEKEKPKWGNLGG